jgi:hypothetical protein
MKYMVRKSYVEVVGRLWMPQCLAATRIPLDRYDVENIRAQGEGEITRDAVDLWLTTHTGDFSEVLDFAASIEDPDTDATIDLLWSSEDSEFTYLDCMFPEDQES